jgi:hypothetical protein
MPQQLLDGTGSGRLARVDINKRLHTDAVTVDRAANASFNGDSYNANTGIINLTSASKSAVFYMKNNESSSNLVIDALFYLIGNSTGGSGDVLITVLRNPTAGTIVDGASDMEMAGVNRNFGSAKTITGDFYKGAEANTFTDGTKVIESIFNQSATRAFVGVGAIVLTPGSSIGVEITPATGNTSLDVEFAASLYVESEE